MAKNRVVLRGSERPPIPNAENPRQADRHERFTVSVVLRRRSELTPPAGDFLSREHLVTVHGATASDLSVVRDFAREFGLQVLAESSAKRTIQLAGTVEAMEAAFGVLLETVEVNGKTHRQRVGPIHLPEDVAPVVRAVLGLDNRQQADTRSRFAATGSFRPFAAGGGALSPLDVARLYGFPAGDGHGQTIAIVELGGGFSKEDLNTYFAEIGVSVPPVTAVSVVGGSNDPGKDPKADGEVMLDIEVAGAIAPRARQLVYFAKNDDQGFLEALKAAIHDNAVPPAAVSISWGSAESKWTQQAMSEFEQTLMDAASLGVTVCIAAGDDGSSDGTGKLTVDFPAAAPHALSCGGTLLQGSGATITNEEVWNDDGATGGGVSQIFGKPSYQSAIAVPPPAGPKGGRGVPDVSGNAAAGSPYKVRVNGADQVAWGTSAVAPLWAGLIALLSQNLGRRVPFLNPLLYKTQVSINAFRDVTKGNNDNAQLGKYTAKIGWDPCTGFGSPRGAKLLAALKMLQPPTPKPPPPPTPKPPKPHPPKPPNPHPPHPHPPGSSGSTGSTGSLPPLPAFEPASMVGAVPQAGIPFSGGGKAVALVALVGTVAVMGMVATTGILAAVAINKDDQ